MGIESSTVSCSVELPLSSFGSQREINFSHTVYRVRAFNVNK